MNELVASVPASNISGKIQWWGGPSVNQKFSLPSSVMYYITKNPSSPKAYNKIIQSCKYFFENNPILVITSMFEDTICSNKHTEGGHDCCVKYDINKILSKIWLTFELHLEEVVISEFTSLLCSKLFQCDVRFLRMVEKVVLFDDFKLLIPSAEIVDLTHCEMVYNDGSPVMLENIIESLPNTTNFSIWFVNDFPMITSSSIRNIAKLKSFQQLDSFYMYRTPEIAKIEDLSKIIKDNKDVCFYFDFCSNISQDYMQQLDGLVDAVIESEVLNHIIIYEGQNREKYKIMKSRFVAVDIFSNDEEDDNEVDSDGSEDLGDDEEDSDD